MKWGGSHLSLLHRAKFKTLKGGSLFVLVYSEPKILFFSLHDLVHDLLYNPVFCQ